MSTRRIKMTAPAIRIRGSKQFVELVIGGRTFVLTTPDDYDSRGLAVALQAARSVTLEIEENPRHPVPEDKT